MGSSCKDILEQASLVLDGEAGLLLRLRFRIHLVICTDCRNYYRQFEEVVAAAAVQGPEDGFDGVDDLVLLVVQRIEEERAGGGA